MLSEKLDFETDPATINLRIRVIDGLTSVQSNMVETDVEIHVIDINDNAPSFKKNLYKIEVLETIASLQTVLVLDIIDEDSAQVNLLGVMLKNGTDFFSVKEERGVFSIIVQEDVSLIGRGFETIKLELEVTDGIFKSDGFVEIEVQGVNLNSPVFYNNNDQIVTNMISIEIEENRDELLLNISSTDADSGPNGHTSIKMKDTSDASNFKFSNGALRFIKIPDYEVKREFTVVLDAFDEGVPPRTTSLTVVIQILDVDDNEPVLNEKIVNSLTFSLKESTPLTIVFPLNTVIDVDTVGKEYNRLCVINSDNSKSCSDQVNSTWPLGKG
jgi:hypothetical protein